MLLSLRKNVSEVRGIGIVLVALLLLVAGGCASVEPSPKPASATPCDDRIEAGLAGSPPAGANLPDAVFIGSGDTFFLGLPGRRWGDNVQYRDGVFDMKVGIYTLATQPPRMSVTRLDGPGTGSVTFAPTGGGLPGPIPLGVTFPNPGCWQLDAEGARGLARIRVSVASPAPSPGG